MASTRYENLVLAGGGVFGSAICGALEVLATSGHLADVRNYAGTSAGAIIAGALACGIRHDILQRELLSADFASFIDYGNPLRGVYNLVTYGGMCPGAAFEQWYGSLIGRITGDPGITLGQLYARNGSHLIIAATHLERRRVVYFDYLNSPDVPLVHCVRMSMSIPFVFIPAEWGGARWIDGGVMDNFPIRCFHDDTVSNDKLLPRTLGIILTGATDANYVEPGGLLGMVRAVLDCFITQAQRCALEPQDWAHTIIIPCATTPPVSSFDFYITQAQKQQLAELGQDAARAYSNSSP